MFTKTLGLATIFAASQAIKLQLVPTTTDDWHPTHTATDFEDATHHDWHTAHHNTHNATDFEDATHHDWHTTHHNTTDNHPTTSTLAE